MVKGYLRPSCLSQDLHHYVLRMDEWFEIRELPILVVVWWSTCGIEIIEYLHSDDAKDIKEEEK